MLSENVSRVPEGLYAIMDLSRWCSHERLARAHLAAPAERATHSAAAVGVSAASPGLPRLTPESCVYSAEACMRCLATMSPAIACVIRLGR
jgi:hypothetical protein